MILRGIVCTGLTLLILFSVSCKGSDPVKPDPPDTDRNVISWGGPGNDSADSVAVDGHGNVFVAGDYLIEEDNGTYDLDPGDDIVPFRLDSGENFFLSKFDSNGNFLWSRVWEVNDGYGAILDIACDNGGNSYIAAIFRGSVDVDPGPAEQMVGSPDNSVLGIMRFDPVGNMQWYVHAGESKSYWNAFFYSDIEVDDSGNVFLGGGFAGVVDFDPGPLEDIHVSISYLWGEAPNWAGVNYEGSAEFPIYEPSCYISKYDSQGKFKWCRTWDAMGDFFTGIAVDSSGGVYVTGLFELLVDFDPGEGITEHDAGYSFDGYLSSFDSAGNLAWVRTWDGDRIFRCEDVASDGSGDAVVIGTFYGEMNIDPTPGNENNTDWLIELPYGTEAMSLLRFDRNGGFHDAQIWDYRGHMSDLEISTIPDGTTWILATFGGFIDFEPGLGVESTDLIHYTSNFLIRVSPDGSVMWDRVWQYPRIGRIDVAGGPDRNAWVACGYAGTPVWGLAPEGTPYNYNDKDCHLIRFPPEGVW